MQIHGIPVGEFLRQLKDKSQQDNLLNGAAALGFFLTLAIFPAMIMVMSVIPYLPIPRVDQAIMDLMRQALPRQAFGVFSSVVQGVLSEQRGGLLSLGAIATLWAASTGMYAIMQQLNITYGARQRRGFLHARAVAIGLSLMFGALMLVAFSLIVLGGIAQDWLGSHFGFSAALLDFFAALRWIIIVLSLTLAFSLTYYFAPNVDDRKFEFITIGGAAGTVLLMAASIGFAVYVQNFAHYSAVYGGIGAVIALMLWLYIAGLSLLIGSEINVLVRRYAGAGRPSRA